MALSEAGVNVEATAVEAPGVDMVCVTFECFAC